MLSVDVRQTAPVPLAARFDCAPGELVALVGPSGSGKSTLLRCIAGLMHPQQGTIGCNGQRWFDAAAGLRLPAQQRRVGLVFQHYALFPHLSALMNVALASSQPQPRRHAAELLDRLGLAGLAARRPSELSGGQQQRVALARALAREPQVLLLDEPFSAVDQPARHDLYRELAELHRAVPLPIVLVTHDLNEARRLADRLVILDHGRTLQQGPPAQLLSQPRNARVAALVGIQNHFDGVFRHTDEPGWARLAWGPDGTLALRVRDKGRIEDGAAVSWVVAAEYIGVHADTTGAPNEQRATLVEALPLGDIALCRFEVAGVAQPVQLHQPTASLQRGTLGVGRDVVLQFDPAGVHIMPRRDTGDAA
ncbi:MAG TPA: ABC transporter ATP-binding protein [Albitalea sp.]|jgi:molybdate transport system ATP-binding protein|nr:ABC transporter ATP-binding protein [Albitalea sp.]